MTQIVKWAKVTEVSLGPMEWVPARSSQTSQRAGKARGQWPPRRFQGASNGDGRLGEPSLPLRARRFLGEVRKAKATSGAKRYGPHLEGHDSNTPSMKPGGAVAL